MYGVCRFPLRDIVKWIIYQAIPNLDSLQIALINITGVIFIFLSAINEDKGSCRVGKRCKFPVEIFLLCEFPLCETFELFSEKAIFPHWHWWLHHVREELWVRLTRRWHNLLCWLFTVYSSLGLLISNSPWMKLTSSQVHL